MIVCVVLDGVNGGYYSTILDSRFANLNELSSLGDSTKNVSTALVLLLIICMFLMIVFAGGLLLFTTYVIFSQVESMKEHKMVKQLVVRDFGLLLATLCGIIYVGLLCTNAWFLIWIVGKLNVSPWISEYETNMAGYWIYWADYVAELMTISLLAWSMRTIVKSGYLYARVQSVFGGSTTRDSSSRSSATDSNMTMTTNDSAL